MQRIFTDPWCQEDKPIKIQFEDITSAAFKLKDGICKTPCVVSNCNHISYSSICIYMNKYNGKEIY